MYSYNFFVGYDAGFTIHKIEYGVNDKAVTSYFFGEKRTKKTKNTIFYNMNGDAYIIKYGIRYYLNNFVKC